MRPLALSLSVCSLAAIAPSCVLASQTEVHGRVFYEKQSTDKPTFLFSGKLIEEKDGVTKAVNTYTDMAGKPVMVEETELHGDRITRYVYKQEQTGDSGDATFYSGKIQYTYTEGGKTDKDSESYDPATIVAPMIQPLIVKRWDDLMKGESVFVRYLAIERCETIGFKFFKDGEGTVNGKSVIKIVMKPSSFIIAALVDPIRISVTKDAPHYLVESAGRTPIRWPKHSPPQTRADWRAIDARVEYDAPVISN
jgi:hypothetical protein